MTDSKPLTSGNDYQGPLYAPHPKMTEQKPDWGTVDYYKNCFADILSDAGCGEQTIDEEHADAILQGFEEAINEWLAYHESCIKSYRNMHAAFLGIKRVD